MADQTNVPNSPAWKKPSDIMKVRLKKQRASSVDSFQALKNKTVPRNRFSSSEEESNNRRGKRRNPFGQDGTPPARRRVSQKSSDDEKVNEQGNEPDLKREDSREEESGAEGVSLFQALDSENDKVWYNFIQTSQSWFNHAATLLKLTSNRTFLTWKL